MKKYASRVNCNHLSGNSIVVISIDGYGDDDDDAGGGGGSGDHLVVVVVMSFQL